MSDFYVSRLDDESMNEAFIPLNFDDSDDESASEENIEEAPPVPVTLGQALTRESGSSCTSTPSTQVSANTGYLYTLPRFTLSPTTEDACVEGYSSLPLDSEISFSLSQSNNDAIDQHHLMRQEASVPLASETQPVAPVCGEAPYSKEELLALRAVKTPENKVGRVFRLFSSPKFARPTSALAASADESTANFGSSQSPAQPVPQGLIALYSPTQSDRRFPRPRPIVDEPSAKRPRIS